MKLSMETHGSGEAIVLIHGMGSAATAWKPIIPELAKRFEVITLDLQDMVEAHTHQCRKWIQPPWLI